MTDEMKSLINQWCREYEIPIWRISCKFFKLHSLLGITSFSYYNFNEYPIADIEIKEYLKDYPFAWQSIAWHEFCHAESWVKYNIAQGHSTAWVKRMLRKPWYIIGCVYAQIICIGK